MEAWHSEYVIGTFLIFYLPQTSIYWRRICKSKSNRWLTPQSHPAVGRGELWIKLCAFKPPCKSRQNWSKSGQKSVKWGIREENKGPVEKCGIFVVLFLGYTCACVCKPFLCGCPYRSVHQFTWISPYLCLSVSVSSLSHTHAHTQIIKSNFLCSSSLMGKMSLILLFTNVTTWINLFLGFFSSIGCIVISMFLFL